MRIIIQAGGKGTRLGELTRNRPKCLVPVDNLPILFHAFRNFPDADFTIICDYKSDVLEKYLAAFASQYSYRLVKAKHEGTSAGIRESIADLSDDEPFVILWSDLIFSENFQVPESTSNLMGISKDFECRWSYIDGQLIEQPSKDNGVAGLFAFQNKRPLADAPEEGAFVGWLSTQDLPFERLDLYGTKEIGTLASHDQYNEIRPRCRPFNVIQFENDVVIKRPVNEQGKAIAENEINWFRKVREFGYEHVPEIIEFEPLTMKRVPGKNVYEIDSHDPMQKLEILNRAIEALKDLHELQPPKPPNIEDCHYVYVTKTFDRLSKIAQLVPFANRDCITINGQSCRNVLFEKEKLTELLRDMIPETFNLIHGDCTFSNLIYEPESGKIVMIDPRGNFGSTKLYGDPDYDWAKLYYSLKGDYDQFNQKRFSLDIQKDKVELEIRSNNWCDMEENFFELLPAGVDRQKIRMLHAVIWLSLTTYAWEDYDSICGAFYNGLLHSRSFL